MPNSYFQFRQFMIRQELSAMKVTTDASLFGAWVTDRLKLVNPGAGRMLDIGTGTGLLSLMVAQGLKVEIDAVEIDADTATEATTNIEGSTFRERISVRHGAIQQFEPGYLFDVIICNPPFYEKEWISPDPGRARAHHGSDLSMTELLQVVKRLLRQEGKFYLLLPFKRREELTALFEINKVFPSVEIFISPVEGHPYSRYAIEAGFHESGEVLHEKLVIKNRQQQYTKEFIRLLKDYYLYL